ncbi:membrane dipeptidase [Pseudooceanicola sp. CBS1P-1]|uniref:Peptidase M19 n=1 Tax=Pseudooceanicola albus TaxID=2692189 RepID=A0A6L7GBD7_9RHOB|nr:MULTISPECIES: dipeptidase [Pseudooceanicola]MBT9386557.1 membrane dipeptidase [Pseudooceanicola endophyticus]MXN20590.1 peptidase M19 [Pseudooceanicola albus]
MAQQSLHDDLIVFDGLIISDWGPEVFGAMRAGGLTAANCTCSVWEGFRDTMRNIGAWNGMIRAHSDSLLKARSTDDIRRAKAEGKTGIVLGFQNTTAFEDRLEYIELFKDMGVGIVQMTYNTQNLVGSGCYEGRDSGLSDFGHEVVAEMNRVGMLCDLSHVGPQTSRDVIEASKRPVAYSHCLPYGLKAHPRNKTDDQLRFIAEHEGFVGVTMFPPFLAAGNDATIDDYVAAIDYIVNLVGEESVGFGTDFTMGYGAKFFEYLNRDKGYARQLTEIWKVEFPDGLESVADFPNLTAAMQRAGWSETKIRRIMGENWLSLLDRVWTV